jgi:hypothetical protein
MRIMINLPSRKDGQRRVDHRYQSGHFYLAESGHFYLVATAAMRLAKYYAKWQRSNVQIAKRFITRPFARDDNSRHPRKTPQVANEIASK